VSFQVLAAASTKIRTFWDVAPDSLSIIRVMNHRDDDDDGGKTHL
jgi:hypothetical protein